MSGVVMYTNRVFGTAECVPFIKALDFRVSRIRSIYYCTNPCITDARYTNKPITFVVRRFHSALGQLNLRFTLPKMVPPSCVCPWAFPNIPTTLRTTHRREMEEGLPGTRWL